MVIDITLEEPVLSYYAWLIENSTEIRFMEQTQRDVIHMKNLEDYNKLVSQPKYDGHRFYYWMDCGWGKHTISFKTLDVYRQVWFCHSEMFEDPDFEA